MKRCEIRSAFFLRFDGGVLGRAKPGRVWVDAVGLDQAGAEGDKQEEKKKKGQANTVCQRFDRFGRPFFRFSQMKKG